MLARLMTLCVAGLPCLLLLSLSGFETPKGSTTLIEAVLAARSDLREGTFELPCTPVMPSLLCECELSMCVSVWCTVSMCVSVQSVCVMCA